MIKIVHLSDIHIRNYGRYDEYEEVFNRLYEILKIEKPNIICNLGDTFDQFIDISNEAKLQAGNFLNNLTLYCDEVVQVIGNHDIRKRNLKRVNSVETIIKLIDNPKIKYLDTSNFFVDELYPIVWVNHSHLEKNINPWIDIPHSKEKGKIYIDLFHDPINGAVGDNGMIFNKPILKNIQDFKGEISLFGDLHKSNQEITKNKKYSGSLIQQSFGEDIEHGVLIWEISGNKIENRFVEIPNDYAFVNININCDVDYNKLKLKPIGLSKFNKLKVNWTDLAVNITNENETKIKKYLKEKYNPIDIEIKPNRIYTDIKDGKMLSDIVDINNKEVQQTIIHQYLKENKFEIKFIEKIIKIDDIINDRLELSETKNIIWNIDKLWFDNFRSYGDNNVLDLNEISGTILIGGENQSGKSSIIDLICFVLYGTTLSTTKQEKNGNNRYINKYRDLNYCEGGCLLDINGEKYIMKRRVDREIKKGIIKSCSMTLDYYRGSVMIDENKLTGENKIKTQQFLNSILGNMEDFIRMAVTNSENLNNLLSIDKSVFIDSVVRDAGYEIFEQKLLEFKNYVKELNLDKINLNENDVENQIVNMTIDLKDKEDYLSDIDLNLESIEKLIDNETSIKDNYLRKLHKIDDKFINLDIKDINNIIYINEQKLINNKLEIDNISEQIIFLPKDFDINYFDSISAQYDKYIKEKNKRTLAVIELKSTLTQNKNKILNVDKDIDNEKSNYFKDLENDIKDLQVELNDDINNKSIEYSNKKMNYENMINFYKKEIDNYKSDGIEIKKKIFSYEEMKNSKNSVCPTCNQEIINCDHVHIDGLILECNNKLIELSKNGKYKLTQIEDIKLTLDGLNNNHDNFLTVIKKEYEEKIEKIQNKIDNFDIILIKEKVENILLNKEESLKENEIISIKMNEHSKFLERLELEIDKKQNKIDSLKKEKLLFEKSKSLRHKKDILSSTDKDIQKIIDDNKRLLNDYEENIKFIKENEKLNTLIKDSYLKLNNLKNKKVYYSNNKLSYSNEITLLKKVIEDLVIKLERYREQQQLYELHNIYIKLMHRTGLPTYLLMKNIDLLNREMSSLLTNTNFILFFDDDLNLKLQHSGKNEYIDAISASGMERVFAVLCLKVSLRNLNFKSKCNLIMLDEIMNRLVNQSVDKFMELLETIKTKIDKIIIIEHNVDFQPNHLINVIKDKDGISSFEII